MTLEEIKDGEGWVFIDDMADTGQTAVIVFVSDASTQRSLASTIQIPGRPRSTKRYSTFDIQLSKLYETAAHLRSHSSSPR